MPQTARSRRVLVTCAAALFALSSFAPVARADGEYELVAGGDVLWAIEFLPHPSGTNFTRIAARPTDAPATVPFSLLRIDPSKGRVTRSFAIEDRIHVFFGDGSHRRFRVRFLPTGFQLAADSSTERVLPHSVLPSLVTGDDAHPVGYALITSRQAGQIERKPSAVDNANRLALDEDTPLWAVPPAVPAPVVSGADYAIVRFESGEWHWDRTAPAELSLDAQPVTLIAHDQQLHLLYQPADDTSLVHQKSLDPDSGWGPSREVPIDRDEEIAASGWMDSMLLVAIAPKSGHHSKIRCLYFDGSRWGETPLAIEGTLIDGKNLTEKPDAAGGDSSTPKSMPVKNAPTRVESPRLQFEVHRDALLVSRHQKPDLPTVERWSISTGQRVDEPQPLLAFAPPKPPIVSPTVSGAIEYLILGLILLIVFVWRRERMMLVAPLPKGIMFADLGRRTLALFIDFVILSPAWLIVAAWMARSFPPDWPLWDLATLARRIETVPWFRAGMGLVFGLYAIPFEILIGATPGKRIVGCFVLTEDGTRRLWWRVLVRNLLRPIEFHFVPIAALVPLTPAKQRVGDLLARTVVIQRQPPLLPSLDERESSPPDNHAQ